MLAKLYCWIAVLGLICSATCRAATPAVVASGLNNPGNIIVDGSTIYWTEEPTPGVAGFPTRIGSVSKTASNDAAINYNYTVNTYGAGSDLHQDSGFLYYASGYTDGTYAYSALYKGAKAGGSPVIISPLKNPFWTDYGPGAFAIEPVAGRLYYNAGNQAPNDKDDTFNSVVSLSTLGGSESILTYSSFGWGAGGNYTINGTTWYFGLAALVYDKSKNNSFSYCSTKGFTSASTDGTSLYWSDGTAIWSRPLVGGDPTILVSGSNAIYSIATPTTGAAAGSIFWLEASAGSASLKRRDVSGQITTVLAPSPDMYVFHRSFAVSDDKVYSNYTGGLVEVSINGGASTILVNYAAGLGPISVATDDAYLYWSLGDRIMRLAKPGGLPTPTPGLAGNVSTRLPVGTGDNVLIEGFTVQGPGGSAKKIIVRGIGPSLLPFGVTDALANPTLEIHDSSNTTIATNNDWRITQVGGIITADQSGEIAASGLAPGNDLESAVIANLAPGRYTAIVRGFGNTTGTGVVDAYDLSGSSPASLVNVATRGLIQPGDQLMISGFIIQNGPVKAVVRAIGPSLTAFGVNNALPDTTLQIKNQNGTIVIENDDWQSDQKQELENTGLQPSNNLEAAVVVTLQPGQYSALVRGKPETTGTGVVQVYFLR